MGADEGFIKLCDFLKLHGAVDSGGQAKIAIQAGDVTVNGDVETRRRKKLRVGDTVSFNGSDLTVKSDDIKS